MLLIVILLVSVGIPLYQSVRNAALISSMVDQLMTYAKVCVVINSSGIGVKPELPSLSPVRGGVRIKEGCDGEHTRATLEASWGDARAKGIPCYSSLTTLSSRRALIIINADGVITCSYED